MSQNPMQTDEGGPRWPDDSEAAEREAAVERGRVRRQGTAEGGRERRVHAAVRRNEPAFAALADHVRDYGIFLLDAHGVITFWGEGAHLMQWWTMEEAEGAHLRLLYPQGGSEDGTAGDHLRLAAGSGVYAGEGTRVRRDGSTFWAHVTLTALHGAEERLTGFAGIMRDLSARRGMESMVAGAHADRAAANDARVRVRDAEAAQLRAEQNAEFQRERADGAGDYIHRHLEPELEEARERTRPGGR